ncbi:MAG: phytoene desaturase family protein [Hyphomicrobium sp.]|nr:phytoene desaturase family protein [Hyphomicrobium sp.]
MKRLRVVVIGAGAGGLAAAVDLARNGADVTVLERAASPGGKMRQVVVDGHGIDAGPTVFTMRWIFEGLFRDSGADLSSALTLTPAVVLARHAWTTGGTLDLFADITRSADAIGAFAGAKDASGYLAFCKRARDIYRTLQGSFISMERPASALDLTMRVGFGHLDQLWRTAPMKTLWGALGDYFTDPRLRQLFGRYATYVGSSPLSAPATLMLIAHVEQDGVWLVDGGMRAVADAIKDLAERNGARFRFGCHVAEIVSGRGGVTAVKLDDGDVLACDAVVFNGDAAALAKGLLGRNVSGAAPDVPQTHRSLSAVTWCLHAKTRGFPLSHHTVFFAEDYPSEFDTVFRKRQVPARPTVYVCAQDRGALEVSENLERERLLVLINAPADGDIADVACGDEATALWQAARSVFATAGLQVEAPDTRAVLTAPEHFNTLFPGNGGALYGRANHSAFESFARPGAVSSVPGLYLAGGSVHPGAGVPMATMSGRIAAARVIDDWSHSRAGTSRRGPIRIPTP